MRNFRWGRLKNLNRLILLGAVAILIGVVVICTGHLIGIAVCGFGLSLIISRGYVLGEWFRDPPSDQ